MVLTCPKCETECSSLRGWKRHATQTHYGYTAEDLEAINAQIANVGSAATGFASFEEAAAAAPSTDAMPEEHEEKPRRRRRSLSPEAEQKRIEAEARLKNLRHVLCAALARLPFSALESQMDSAPTQSEINEVAEAWETALEALNVKFNVEALSIEVRSWKWLLAIPLVSTIVVFIKHYKPSALESPSEKVGGSA